MSLLTKEQNLKLVANAISDKPHGDIAPVVYIAIPTLQMHWLITEMIDETEGVAYGLVDLHNGKPFEGEIRLSDIVNIKEQNNVMLLNDAGFATKYSLAVFSSIAKELGRIAAIEDGLSNEFAAVDMKVKTGRPPSI